jgi:uncharacterized protein with von Willebrand factor type A (vWA) domain
MKKNTPEIIEAIQKDGFDRFSWKNISEQVQDFQVEDAQKALLGDVFSSFYKIEPTVTEGESTAHSILKTQMNTQEWNDLRAHTQLDEIGSAIATKTIQGAVLEAQEEAEKAKEEGKEVDENGIRRAFRAAAKKAEKACEDSDEVVQVLTGGAGKEAGDWKKIPFGDKMNLVNKFSKDKKFKKIADLFGRFKNLALGMIDNNVTHGVDELHDIACGNDLGRLVPSEFLNAEMSEVAFFNNFINASLLQYDLKGAEPKGKGPIVCCLDVSGSMEEFMGGLSKDAWAKAVALGLALLAEKQKRSFSLVCFESQVKFAKRYDKFSIQDKLEFLSVQPSGGTCYDAALTKACNIIKNDNGMRPADIVFITDGQDELNVGALVQETKKSTGARVCTIGIGCSVKVLESIADAEINVKSLEDIEVIRTAFGKVIAG